MTPISETSEEIVYVLDGVTYRVRKVNPPVLVIEADYSAPAFADRPQTWLELKARFDAQEII